MIRVTIAFSDQEGDHTVTILNDGDDADVKGLMDKAWKQLWDWFGSLPVGSQGTWTIEHLDGTYRDHYN